MAWDTIFIYLKNLMWWYNCTNFSSSSKTDGDHYGDDQEGLLY